MSIIFHIGIANPVYAQDRCRQLLIINKNLTSDNGDDLFSMYQLLQSEKKSKDNLKALYLYQTLLSQLRSLYDNGHQKQIYDFFKKVYTDDHYHKKYKSSPVYHEKSFFPILRGPSLKISNMSFLLIEIKNQFVYLSPENELTILSVPDFKLIRKTKLQKKIDNLIYVTHQNTLYATDEYKMLVKINLDSFEIKTYNLRPIQPSTTRGPYFISPSQNWLFYQHQNFDAQNLNITHHFYFHKVNKIAESKNRIQLLTHLKQYGFAYKESFFWQLSEKSEFKLSEIDNPTNSLNLMDILYVSLNHDHILLTNKNGDIIQIEIQNRQIIANKINSPFPNTKLIATHMTDDRTIGISQDQVLVKDAHSHQILFLQNYHFPFLKAQYDPKLNLLFILLENNTLIYDIKLNQILPFSTASYFESYYYDADTQILIDYSKMSPWITAYNLKTKTFQLFKLQNSNPMQTDYDSKSGLLFSSALTHESLFTTPSIQQLDFYNLFQTNTSE